MSMALPIKSARSASVRSSIVNLATTSTATSAAVRAECRVHADFAWIPTPGRPECAGEGVFAVTTTYRRWLATYSGAAGCFALRIFAPICHAPAEAAVLILDVAKGQKCVDTVAKPHFCAPSWASFVRAILSAPPARTYGLFDASSQPLDWWQATVRLQNPQRDAVSS